MKFEKIVDLGKKLKALADRGEGGEKVNARALLEKLLKTHGLTIEDLEMELETYHDFKFKNHQLRFFQQIASTVLGSNYSFGKYDENSLKKNTYTVKCTHVQAIEVQAKFNFYWALYVREREANAEIFYTAFIMKQCLSPADAKPKKVENLTPEELEDFMKIFTVAETIKKQDFKQTDNELPEG